MRSRRIAILGTMLFALCSTTTTWAQGLIMGGAGAMHRSMGGASTAVATDAAGALYWNPATISGLPSSEVVIGSELILADTYLGSTVPGGAFGPQAGMTRSDSGIAPTTAVALVYQPEGTNVTYGIGLATLAGGGVNFPGDTANPLLSPVGPGGQFILGPQAANLMILNMTPTTSVQVTEKLAFAVGGMIDVAAVSFDPAFFGPASQIAAGFPKQFPTGSHSRPFWGGGFRAGTTYKVTDDVTAGFSYSSPHWFETWRFNARDANGDPINFRTQFSIPQIFSGGLSYQGIDRLLVSLDVHWFDYRTTQLLGQSVVDGGAGWDSIWSAALGFRYKLTEQLSLQAGYLYNQNPISSNIALFNTQLPAVIMHTVSCGTYLQLNESIGASLAYVHGFQNSVTGNLLQIPGTSTTISSEYDSIAFNLHVRFGARRSELPVAE